MVSGASGWTERAAQTSVSYSVRLFLSWIIIPARWTGKKEPILIRQNLPWQQQYTSNRSPRCGGAIKSHWRRRDSRSTRAQLSFSLAPFLLIFLGPPSPTIALEKHLMSRLDDVVFYIMTTAAPQSPLRNYFRFIFSSRREIKSKLGTFI